MCTQWAIKMGLNTLVNRLSTLANWTLAKRLVCETMLYDNSETMFYDNSKLVSNFRTVTTATRHHIKNNKLLLVKNHPNYQFFDGKFIQKDRIIRWTCNQGKYVRFGVKTSQQFEA